MFFILKETTSESEILPYKISSPDYCTVRITDENKVISFLK